MSIDSSIYNEKQGLIAVWYSFVSMASDVLQCPQVELLKSGTFSISFSSLISNIILTISKQDGKMNSSATV